MFLGSLHLCAKNLFLVALLTGDGLALVRLLLPVPPHYCLQRVPLSSMDSLGLRLYY